MKKVFSALVSLVFVLMLASCSGVREGIKSDLGIGNSADRPKKEKVVREKKAREEGSKKTAADIEIFWGDEKPTQPYKAIGQVSTYRFSRITGFPVSDERVYENLKKQAAGKGGDAIIGIKEDFASKSGTVIIYKKTDTAKPPDMPPAGK